jgi:replicative DNA helicase
LPVIALSQLSRESEKHNRRPKLSDLRESGAIEQAANSVTFVYHPPQGDSANRLPLAELIVEANRSGPTGTAQVRWFGKTTTFLDSA